jgi:signal transduction histidine kinase
MSEMELPTALDLARKEIFGRLKSLSAAAALLDRAGTVLHANARFADILGRRGQELAGLSLTEIVPRTVDPAVFARIVAAAQRTPGKAHKLSTTRHDRGVSVQVDLLLTDLGAEEQIYVLAMERTPPRRVLESLRRRVDELESILEAQNAPGMMTGQPSREPERGTPEQPSLPYPALAGCIAMGAYLDMHLRSIKRGHDLAVKVSAEDLALDARRANLIALIATELVANGLQHAFPGRRDGTIEVSLRRRGADFELIVADNGTGLASTIPTDPHAIGLRLVQLYAQRLHARVSLQVSGGSRFTIRFPVEYQDPGAR